MWKSTSTNSIQTVELGIDWVCPRTVTTRIITFLVGDSYKPWFPSVTGRGPHQRYRYSCCSTHPWQLEVIMVIFLRSGFYDSSRSRAAILLMDNIRLSRWPIHYCFFNEFERLQDFLSITCTFMEIDRSHQKCWIWPKNLSFLGYRCLVQRSYLDLQYDSFFCWALGTCWLLMDPYHWCSQV